ncbi:uncharacterized protein GIQ15_03939 [Arthroderma uncinatum]|uniref:uncharacterized protein n=1 Tax=Arthroderma uncinatum TaxID=74035 RepID=UPI00144AF5C2|nr:uncharacterized protein GIQ15_03939 [Arthroderma uncinatum]KAF3481180.1 hypothetical protein GIQ15_03939 [Arthroderma uncinatum]
MKRFIGTITSRRNSALGAGKPNDSPEVAVLKAVVEFCDNSDTNNGNEYLQLPTIVEAAESSPEAAKIAAHQIQKYLSKPASSHPQRQYNAIMLIRILSDNPGPSFTRNIDSRFTACVKILLRDGRDMHVAQILRETLETLSVTKANDTNLTGLIQMWTKEKEKFQKTYGYPPFGLQQPVQNNPTPGPQPGQRQDYFSRQHRLRGLPPPGELAARVNEANESAKLLQQMLLSTPVSEFYQNDMLKEFATRCQSASRSVQGYINSSDPAPDADTMLTLIETNDKISVALSRYNRATLDARKAGFKSPEERAEQAQRLADSNPNHHRNHSQNHQTEQPYPQVTGALPAGTEPESIPTKKQRYIPRLSMPRIPKKLSKQSPDQPPAPNGETKPALYIPPTNAGNVEGAPISPPLSPPRTFSNHVSPIHNPEVGDPYANGTSTLNNGHSSNYTTDTANINHLPPTTTAPPISWEYNPNEFQVENPFADKFATDANSGTDSNRVSRIVEPESTAAAGGATTTTGHNQTDPSTKRERYYSQSEYNLFDNTKQTASEALALAPGSSTGNKPTVTSTTHS